MSYDNITPVNSIQIKCGVTKCENIINIDIDNADLYICENCSSNNIVNQDFTILRGYSGEMKKDA